MHRVTIHCLEFQPRRLRAVRAGNRLQHEITLDQRVDAVEANGEIGTFVAINVAHDPGDGGGLAEDGSPSVPVTGESG